MTVMMIGWWLSSSFSFLEAGVFIICVFFFTFWLFFFFFFFFQAEDGIRDLYVTGVQTCALPICQAILRAVRYAREAGLGASVDFIVGLPGETADDLAATQRLMAQVAEEGGRVRSEERRVGKECRCGWGGDGWREKKEGRGTRVRV